MHHQPTSFPSARVPHAWVFDDAGHKTSTLDLCGQGRFTILTGIGGDGWEEAAKTVGKELGIEIAIHKIGPRQHWQDFSGDWMRAREIRDGGCLLVRPDQHVGWCSDAASDDAGDDLRKAMKQILAL